MIPSHPSAALSNLFHLLARIEFILFSKLEDIALVFDSFTLAERSPIALLWKGKYIHGH